MEMERKVSRGDVEYYDLEILLRRPSLRTSIPRRASPTCQDGNYTERTTCGFGCIRGQWMQSFANGNSYGFIYGVLGSFYGIIASAGDITHVIMYFVLSLCVPKGYRPKLVGLGVLIIAASTVMFSMPHFLYERRNMSLTNRDSIFLDNETDAQHCGGRIRMCAKNLEVNGPFIVLIITQILHGIGGSLYYVAGKSYKDDNTEKLQPPAALSLASVLKVLGPAFGYWLSSISLKTFESPTVAPIFTDEEPQWIGAWWLGSPVIGFMLIFPGFLVTLFPPTLPKAADKKIHNRLSGASGIKENEAKEKGKLAAVKRLLVNPTFNCTHFAALFNVMGFIPYFIFLPKYVEIQYRVPASKASLVAGSITLLSSAIGIVTGNSVITRNRPSAKLMASWTVVVGILSVGGLISLAYQGCHENDKEINTMITQSLALGWLTQAQIESKSNFRHLNSTCKCVDFSFFPVCDEHNHPFVTPCHAGCDNNWFKNNTQILENCTYGMDYSAKSDKVLRGFCPVDCHSQFLKYIMTTCLITFFYATGRTPIYWFETKFNEKFTFLNSAATLAGLVAFIPAPVIFGYLLDESCLLWDGNCENIGNCWLYDNARLRLSINLTAIGFAIIGSIFDLGVWYTVKDLELFDHVDCYGDENYES